MNIRVFPRRKRSIYRLKVTLLDVRPLIWRRIQLPGATPLDRLHRILQVVFGWQGQQEHQFVFGDERFEENAPRSGSEAGDESRVLLCDILHEPRDEVLYEYDFADGWEHRIVLEATLPIEESSPIPVCLAGSRAAPPEGIGGPPGYRRLLRVLANPAHPDFRDYCRRLPEDFDAEVFDIEDVNERLSGQFGSSATA